MFRKNEEKPRKAPSLDKKTSILIAVAVLLYSKLSHANDTTLLTNADLELMKQLNQLPDDSNQADDAELTEQTEESTQIDAQAQPITDAPLLAQADTHSANSQLLLSQTSEQTLNFTPETQKAAQIDAQFLNQGPIQSVGSSTSFGGGISPMNFAIGGAGIATGIGLIASKSDKVTSTAPAPTVMDFTTSSAGIKADLSTNASTVTVFKDVNLDEIFDDPNDTNLGRQTLDTVENNVSVANTVVGSPFHDQFTASSTTTSIQGGDGNDLITGGSGTIDIQGGTGNDTITAGSGTTTISGGEGNDLLTSADNNANVTLDGGAGDDVLDGKNANDHLIGGEGKDTLSGNAGNDTLKGDAGDDTLSGGTGDDILYGGSENDQLKGDAGNDILQGDAGNDTLTGGADHDTLNGGAGDDTLSGGTGTNLVYGGAGDDTVSGEQGDDTIFVSSGNNTLDGGQGHDTLSFKHATHGATATLNSSMSESGFNDGSTSQATNFESMEGSKFNDTLTGEANKANTIFGSPGSDTLDGGERSTTDAAQFNTLDYSTLDDDTTLTVKSVHVNLATQTVTSPESGDATFSDTVTNFNHIVGTKEKDTLIGDIQYHKK